MVNNKQSVVVIVISHRITVHVQYHETSQTLQIMRENKSVLRFIDLRKMIWTRAAPLAKGYSYMSNITKLAFIKLWKKSKNISNTYSVSCIFLQKKHNTKSSKFTLQIAYQVKTLTITFNCLLKFIKIHYCANIKGRWKSHHTQRVIILTAL